MNNTNLHNHKPRISKAREFGWDQVIPETKMKDQLISGCIKEPSKSQKNQSHSTQQQQRKSELKKQKPPATYLSKASFDRTSQANPLPKSSRIRKSPKQNSTAT